MTRGDPRRLWFRLRHWYQARHAVRLTSAEQLRMRAHLQEMERRMIVQEERLSLYLRERDANHHGPKR